MGGYIKVKFGFLVLLILAVTLAVNVNAQLADSPWPMFRGNLQHTGLSPYNTSHVDGTVKWTFETGGGVESSPVIGSDGTIYVGSHDGYLYALNPDGALRWKFKAGNLTYDKSGEVSKSILATPALAKDGTIYISGSSNYLFALTPEGKEKWRFFIKWDPAFWNGPTVGDDGTIYAASARNEGAKDYPSGVYALTPDGKEKWRFSIRSGVPSVPTIGADKTIYINAFDTSKNQGKIFALDPNGKLKWEFAMEQWQEGSSAIAKDGTIYTGSKEGNVYAVTPEGKERWRFVTNSAINSIPAIAKDGTIYVGSNDGTFYAIAPDGKERWEFKAKGGIESSATISADGTIYFGDNAGYFYAINPDGTEKWRFENLGHGFVSSSAISKDGAIYVGSADKKFYAFGNSKAPKIQNSIKNENKSEEMPAVGIGNQTPVENKEDGKTSVEVKTFCGNYICEPPAETSETCWDDCCLSPECGKPEEDFKKENTSKNITISVNKEYLKEKKEIFKKIINFFRRLLGK